MNKTNTTLFNVFLSHNSQDKPAVHELKQALVAARLSCWLDEDELAPGTNWQPEIEAGMKNSISAAVCFGPAGIGPWEDEEMQTLLKQAVNDKKRVIPVLLPGAPEKPPIPAFLSNRIWVDFRSGFTADGLKRLIWGITGKKPRKVPRYHKTTIQQQTVPPCSVDFSKLQPPSTKELIGRSAKCDELQKAFESNSIAILGIIADGGFGKSAIVYDWLNHLDVSKYGLTHVYAWAFNDSEDNPQGNTSLSFFINTFKFFGDLPPPQISNSEEEKATFLEKVRANNKSILILDGLEALQEKHDEPERRGKIYDDAVREFLQQTIRIRRNHKERLVIVTSRLPLSASMPKYGYLEIGLENLDQESGAYLLNQLGVEGSGNDLKAASNDYNGHCLSLVLLGNIIANWFPDRHIRNRNIIHTLTAHIPYQTSSLEHAHRVMSFYETSISAPHDIILLEMMGLFHSAMENSQKECLAEHAQFACEVKNLSSKEWNDVARKLERYGLLSKERAGQPREYWNCHPLIREHFRDRLFRTDSGWRDAQAVLFSYFQRQAQAMPSTLQEMIPLYRAVHHGCHAGKYQEALALYKTRILRDTYQAYSTNRLGAATEDVAALQRFFHNEGKLYLTLNESEIAWLRARMAFCQTCLGRLDEAIDNRKKQRDFAEKQGNLKDMASASEHLSGLFLLRGNIFAAEEAAERAISLAQQARLWEEEIRGRCRLAAAEYLRGESRECEKELKKAIDLHQEYEGTTPHLFSEYGLYYRLWLLDTASTPEEYEAVLHEAEGAYQHDQNWLAPMGMELMVKGISLWKLGKESSGEIVFRQAKDTLTEAGYVVYMPYYFNVMADYWLAKGNFDEAAIAVDQARGIAQEYGMPLFVIDSKLIEAKILVRKGDISHAKDLVTEVQKQVTDRSYNIRTIELTLLKAEIAVLEKQPEAELLLSGARSRIDATGRKSLLRRWQEIATIQGK